MESVVGNMKVGAPLIMGAYGTRNDNPYPIVWLKGTPNGDFITQFALDVLGFDAQEPDNTENRDARAVGNPNYGCSNILQFLNAQEENWFSPMHQYDASPARRRMGYAVGYDTHNGFLYHFEDYEIECLQEDIREVGGNMVRTLIRLPSAEDVIGDNRFQLFRKRGIRPKGTHDLIANRSLYIRNLQEESYIPFWISDLSTRVNYYASMINRMGNVDTLYPKECSGIRPVCTIKAETKVELHDDGFYYIVPTSGRNVFTDGELFELLGLSI